MTYGFEESCSITMDGSGSLSLQQLDRLGAHAIAHPQIIKV
jgi:hypothetical protein